MTQLCGKYWCCTAAKCEIEVDIFRTHRETELSATM